MIIAKRQGQTILLASFRHYLIQQMSLHGVKKGPSFFYSKTHLQWSARSEQFWFLINLICHIRFYGTDHNINVNSLKVCNHFTVNFIRLIPVLFVNRSSVLHLCLQDFEGYLWGVRLEAREQDDLRYPVRNHLLTNLQDLIPIHLIKNQQLCL